MTARANRPYVTSSQMDAAYSWLIRQRRHFPANADIWDVRRHWPTLGPRLMAWINAGICRFSPMQQVHKTDGEVIRAPRMLWSSSA